MAIFSTIEDEDWNGDWSNVYIVNQYIRSVNERFVTSSYLYHYGEPAVVGDDVQSRNLWYTLQSTMINKHAQFRDLTIPMSESTYYDNAYDIYADTFCYQSKQEMFNRAGLPNGYRRSLDNGVTFESNTKGDYETDWGQMRRGDCIGLWIFEDLRKMFAIATIIVTNEAYGNLEDDIGLYLNGTSKTDGSTYVAEHGKILSPPAPADVTHIECTIKGSEGNDLETYPDRQARASVYIRSAPFGVSFGYASYPTLSPIKVTVLLYGDNTSTSMVEPTYWDHTFISWHKLREVSSWTAPAGTTGSSIGPMVGYTSKPSAAGLDREETYRDYYYKHYEERWHVVLFEPEFTYTEAE